MKKIIAALLLVLFNSIVLAQHIYTLKIVDLKSKPMTNVEVVAFNNDDGTSLRKKTDSNGTVEFSFVNQGTYSISYLDRKNALSYVVKLGSSGYGTRSITYDPEGVFATKSKQERSGIVFKEQTASYLKNSGEAAIVSVEVKNSSEEKLNNANVYVLDFKNKLRYKNSTNANGIAEFYLPINNDYEIDVEDAESVKIFNVPNSPNAKLTIWVYYERTLVDEIVENDTIFQNNITQTAGTNTHMLFTLNLTDYNGLPLGDENVYIDGQNSSKVYCGKTDKSGVCKFMLEKGDNYIVSLQYDRGVYLVDAKNTKGFGTAFINRRYRGSREIEKIMAERQLNKDGFVINHEETPVKIAIVPTNYLTKTNLGFDLKFEESGPLGTPTIVGENLLTQKGFYSPEFYCFHAITGKYIWGLELGESGMSPIVYSNGVLLINTFSCTLYAIDANDGKMLWSKWLAGTIYSTPSADNNSVFVVYDNGYDKDMKHGENFVLTSFDLRTGKMNWVQRVDDEAIACPVLDADEVHLASQSGNYYVFDKNNGNLIAQSEKIKAVSSPSVYDNKIYITSSINGKEQLSIYDRQDLSLVKSYKTQLNAAKIIDNTQCFNQMNFNGSHPIVYKNKYVILTDKSKIYAFDANSEKIIWQHNIDVHPNQIPVVANDMVLIPDRNGNLINIDISTGLLEKQKLTDVEADGQICSNGSHLFIGTQSVLKVVKSDYKFSMNQWNRDAGHNLVWK